MGNYEALLVDYTSAKLGLTIIAVTEHGSLSLGEMKLFELGEKVLRGSSEVCKFFSSLLSSMPCKQARETSSILEVQDNKLAIHDTSQRHLSMSLSI